MNTALDPTLHSDRVTAADPAAGAAELAQLDAIAKNRSAIAGAVNLPLTLIAPNPLQPRKRIDPAKIAELAESIAKVGLLQPILVRPRSGAQPGEPTFEIVAGERRWRASNKLAEATKSKRGSPVATIPAIVRELDDYQALEVAGVENLQREDLHPLEEAEGYELLLHPPKQVRGAPAKPLTLRELAAKVGKSLGYMSGRMKLLNLLPKVRDTFYDGKIDFSIALIIARQPQEQQEKLLQECLQGYGGQPFTHAQAEAHVHQRYMLQLSRAPFKITDASLVPEAGSCRECPKRTGANPDLFADVKNGDTCTDSTCFNRKVDADKLRKRQEAEAAGKRVIEAPKAGEYLRLDRHDYNVSYDKAIGQLLGKSSKVETVLIETDEGLVPAVKATDAKAELKAKGVIKPRAGAGGDHQRENEERSKTGTAWRRAVAIDCLNALVGIERDSTVQLGVLRLAAEALYLNVEHDALKRMHDLHGSKPLETYAAGGEKKLRAAVQAMNADDLVRFIAAMCIAEDLHLGTYRPEDKGAGSRLLELAGVAGVDADKVRLAITAERKAAAKEKATPKSAKRAKAA